MARHGRGRYEPDASMTLLSEVYRRPLDPGYREAARRRAAGEPPPRAHRWLSMVVAVILGVAVTVAAVDLRRPSAEAVRARAMLEQEIATQQARADAARAEIRATTAQMTLLQDVALASEDPALLSGLRRDQAASGVVPVTGPGLRIVLSDAQIPDGTEPAAANRVQDVDLRVVVNGLWAAGAEAVAINGARLTSLTAIRTAGSAVLVDLRPLSSPYVVEAIGSPEAVQSALAVSAAGQHLTTLRSTYGIGVQTSSRQDLSLPGTGQVTLRLATVPPATAPPVPVPEPTVPEGSEP